MPLLQGEEMEIASGVHVIESLVGNINTMREKCDEKHEVFYEESNAVAVGLHIPESKPSHRGYGYHDCSISDYYKVRVTIPLLDHFISTLEERFNKDTLKACAGLSIIPRVAMKSLKEGVENRAWKLRITSFAELYIDVMP